MTDNAENPTPTMTVLSALMAGVYGEMFDETDIHFGGDGQYARPIAELTDQQIVVLFRYGKRMYNDNWNSSEAKKDKKSQKDFFADWITKLGVSIGTGKGRGGSRGPALGIEEQAEVNWLKSEAESSKVASKITNKTFMEHLRSRCQAWIYNETADGTEEDRNIALAQTDELFPMWREMNREQDAKLVEEIKLERDRRALQKKEHSKGVGKGMLASMLAQTQQPAEMDSEEDES